MLARARRPGMQRGRVNPARTLTPKNATVMPIGNQAKRGSAFYPEQPVMPAGAPRAAGWAGRT
jgi:hypothetical protein